MGSKGIVASTAALSVLLQEGIGDTIRISLTPEPGGDRTKEVIVGQEILQTMGLRKFAPMVIACPGCGRTTSTTFQELADNIQTYLRESMPEWKKAYPGVEGMNVAVMGCIVNGPGESKHANLFFFPSRFFIRYACGCKVCSLGFVWRSLSIPINKSSPWLSSERTEAWKGHTRDLALFYQTEKQRRRKDERKPN